MDRLGIAKSAFLWSWWNALAEALWPRGGSVPVLRVRYETLTANFEPSLRAIRDLLLPEHAGRPWRWWVTRFGCARSTPFPATQTG